MSILDYRIGLSDRTSKGILDSGFNLDGSEMSPKQQQEYEQFKIENNMSSMPLNSNSVAMQFPSTVSDAVPLNELLGFYSDKGIMAMQNKGTLDYPEVNYKMTTEFPNTRGGLIANPEYIDYTDGELYEIDDTGRIPGFTDRIKGGINTLKDKLGPVGDFFSKGGIMGNILSAFGKRGDESTRGIAGLNVNDVFNIDSFGSDEDPTKDPYGINIVSGFGNYNQYVKDKAKQLSVMKFKTDSANRRKNFYEQAAAQIKAQEEKALAEALAKAQEEINRMGYQDYGSGGASAATQASYEGADGSYAGASTQDYGSGE